MMGTHGRPPTKSLHFALHRSFVIDRRTRSWCELLARGEIGRREELLRVVVFERSDGSAVEFLKMGVHRPRIVRGRHQSPRVPAFEPADDEDRCTGVGVREDSEQKYLYTRFVAIDVIAREFADRDGVSNCLGIVARDHINQPESITVAAFGRLGGGVASRDGYRIPALGFV